MAFEFCYIEAIKPKLWDKSLHPQKQSPLHNTEAVAFRSCAVGIAA